LYRYERLKAVDAGFHLAAAGLESVGGDPEEPDAFGVGWAAVAFGVGRGLVAVEVGEVSGVVGFTGKVRFAELTPDGNADVAEGHRGRGIEFWVCDAGVAGVELKEHGIVVVDPAVVAGRDLAAGEDWVSDQRCETGHLSLR